MNGDDSFCAGKAHRFAEVYASMFEIPVATNLPAFELNFSAINDAACEVMVCPAKEHGEWKRLCTVNDETVYFRDCREPYGIDANLMAEIIRRIKDMYIWEFVTAPCSDEMAEKEYPTHGNGLEPIVHPPVRRKAPSAKETVSNSPAAPIDLPRVLYRNAAELIGMFDFEKYLGLLKVSSPKLPSRQAIGDDIHTAMLPIVNKFNLVQGSWADVTAADLRKFLTAVVLHACDLLISSEPGTPGYTLGMPLVGHVHVRCDGSITINLIPYSVSYPEDA